jgi:hypothetical protein
VTNTALNNKRYGFNAEAELLQYFRDHGLASERLHLTGTEDEGDLTVTMQYMAGSLDGQVLVQLKTYAVRTQKGAERPLSHAKVKGWWKDLKQQRENYRAHRGLRRTPGGILVVKPRGASWDDAMVIHRLGDWVGSGD